MKKKIIKIISFVFIFITIIYGVYKIDSINRRKEKIENSIKYFIDSVVEKNYDNIKQYIKKSDGSELSDQEITNFLQNTGLYRATLIDSKDLSFTHSINVNFFDTNKGVISFSYETLNSELITNELDYYDAGVHEYFVTNDFLESDKEIKRYLVSKDLANGNEINYNNNDNELEKLLIYRYIKDENGDLYLEIIEEAKEDVKIAVFNMLDENFVDIKNEYKYEWNEDCSIFSVYYDSDKNQSFLENLYISTISMYSATIIQTLGDNPDWHLTINYYDYYTKELLSTEIIR